jgi:hypothetical protein
MVESLFNRSYELALDIDEKFRKEYGTALSQETFSGVTTTLQYAQTENGQNKYYAVLDKLTPEELSAKVKKTSLLINALKNLERNRRR